MSVKNLLFFFFVILLLISCTKSFSKFPEKSFRSRLVEADSHIGWGLNYFDSWQKGLQPKYLKLAEKHTITAINMFANLEYDTSPRISEYYVVRERRTRGCRFLSKLQFEAGNYGYKLSSQTPEGCTYF
mgnify:CR=1 FL=1|tara:strand:- start:628 stop:1014 length:387 start_codon:yes stop_codon:yes gene_type:complete